MSFGLPQKTITQLKSVFKKYPEVTQVKIYGSRVTDHYRRGSDIDLAFFYESEKDLSSNLSWELDDLPCPYLFDVVNYNGLDESPLREEIDKNGRLLYKKDTRELKEIFIYESKRKKTKKTSLDVSTVKNNQKWPMMKLGDVCIFEYGKPLKKEDRENGKYPVFGSNGIVGYHNKYLIKGPCIVIGRKGTAGEVTYSENNCFPIDTTFYVKLKNANEYNLKYLYFIMRTLDLKKVSSRSNVPGLNRNDAYKIQVLRPSLPEQKKIAGVLSQIQKAIKVQNKLIKTAEELKKSTMKQLFTYGIKGRKIKGTFLDVSAVKNNQKWPMMKLGDVCIFEYGKPLKKEDRENGKYPVFGSNGIVGYHNKYLIKGPCIVIGRKGTAGEVTYSENNCFPIDTTFYVKLKNANEYNLKYLYFIMRTLGLKKISSRSNVPGLNRNDAYKVQVPRPSLPEQKKIVNILTKIDIKIQTCKKKKSIIEELFKTMLNKLMTGKIRVHRLHIDTSVMR